MTYGSGVDIEVTDMKLCNGQALPAINPGPWPIPLTWFAQGGTVPITTPAVSGFYTAFIGLNLSCEQSQTVFVTIVDTPEVDLTNHTIFECEGTSVAVEAGPAGAFNYSWSHDATEAGSTVVFDASGTYCVTVTTLDGCCSASDCVEIEFVEDPTVAVSYTHLTLPTKA